MFIWGIGHQLGFLPKNAPRMYTIQKAILTISCLCRIHSLLINQKEVNPLTQSIAQDELILELKCAVTAHGGRARNSDLGEEVGYEEANRNSANGLLGGCGHFNDDPGYVMH